MRKIILISVLLILMPSLLQAKEVYFYTNSISGIVGKIRIFKNNQKIAEIGNNQWIYVNVGEIQSCNLVFKWGVRMNKKLELNFNNKDVAFVYIHLDPTIWSVYENTYPSIPNVVWQDHLVRSNEKKLVERKINHPKSNWTEITLTDRFKKQVEPIEGIYENSFKDEGSPRYKIGVVKEESLYKLIYLSGGNSEIWKQGEIKGVLIPTATSNLFKAQWYMEDKSLNDEVFISFDLGYFKLVWADSRENLYIKLYPVADNSTSTTEKVSGTGFALSSDGYIVTNYHVTQGANNIIIRGIKGNFSKKYRAKVVAEDKNNDLAIIMIDDPEFTVLGNPPYTIRQSSTDVGSSVYVLGYPLRATMGDEIKLTNGIISSKSGFQLSQNKFTFRGLLYFCSILEQNVPRRLI